MDSGQSGGPLHSGPLVPLSPERSDGTGAFAALQTGVLVPLPKSEQDRLVTDFIRSVLGIDETTFRREIKTIMLNRRVVDKPDSTTLVSGDVLIISGAMPGLVGAMLRSDSPIKAMRETISCTGRTVVHTTDSHPGYLSLKAFNTVLGKYLNAILEYGVFQEEVDG